MTIDEAIRELETNLRDTPSMGFEDFANALKLGIEALKRVKGNRMYPQPTVYPLLPGETKE